MLSVLIADDEWIEREGIGLLLEQSPYEFKVYMAENGEEAMACMEKYAIDILFTDIKMPFVDGLELLTWANQKYKGLSVVIFSAFADFGYARTALENRAVHYFLKPIDPDEFLRILDGIVKEKAEEQKRQSLQRGEGERVSAFLRGEGPAPEWMEKMLRSGGPVRVQLYDMQEENEAVIAAFYESVGRAIPGLKRYVTISEGLVLLFLENRKENRKVILDFLEHCSASQTCVILGQEIYNCRDLRDQFVRMEEMLRLHFFMDGNQILCFNENREESDNSEQILERIVKEIYYGVENGNDSCVAETLTLLFHELRAHMRDSQIYVKYLYSNILKKMCECGLLPHGEFKSCLDELFGENSLSGIHKMMLSLTERYIEMPKDAEKKGTEQKRVIRDVMEIVRRRYQEDISLQSIAQEVYLSPSYLSYLFKKETGISLIKYITMIRLERAKQLLLSGNMKVSEVAASVGYQNYSYFNITFKNNVGMSPSQFRERRDEGQLT